MMYHVKALIHATTDVIGQDAYSTQENILWLSNGSFAYYKLLHYRYYEKTVLDKVYLKYFLGTDLIFKIF